MRILHFCAGCSLLLSEEEQKEPLCFNCNTETSSKIQGQFTDEDAERLEMAASDQTQ